MKIIELLKGNFVEVKNEIENKKSVLEIEKVEHLTRNEMIHGHDGWETGKFNVISMGFMLHFTNGYKRKYNDLMSIDFHQDKLDELDVNDF